jgi:hypothetical protein
VTTGSSVQKQLFALPGPEHGPPVVSYLDVHVKVGTDEAFTLESEHRSADLRPVARGRRLPVEKRPRVSDIDGEAPLGEFVNRSEKVQIRCLRHWAVIPRSAFADTSGADVWVGSQPGIRIGVPPPRGPCCSNPPTRAGARGGRRSATMIGPDWGVGTWGQANVRRWTDDILPLLTDDDPLGVDGFATHHLPLHEAPDAYATFQRKDDGMVNRVPAALMSPQDPAREPPDDVEEDEQSDEGGDSDVHPDSART